MEIKCLQVPPIGTNCYILCDEAAKVCAVIDPGGDAGRIAAAVCGLDMTPGAILLTHGHYDHTGAVAPLLELLGPVAVYVHRADFEAADTQLFPLRDQLKDVPGADVRFYGEGDRLCVGGLEVQVLHTPGHSKGSVTLRCGDALLCGDTLFAGSCGRTDLTGGSMTEMLSSLRRLGQLEGDLQVLPGHMQPSTLEEERAWNPYLTQAMKG